jgi:hypothetical protein
MSDWTGTGTTVSALAGDDVTLTTLLSVIQGILQDPAYTDVTITGNINVAIQNIAAGIRMPDGTISPPLPDLYAYGVVNTVTSLPYVSLPANYQRNADKIYDSGFNQIAHPRGGDYYSFKRFLGQVNNLNLAETGAIYQVCIKGSKIYYQGIPTTSTPLGLHYYRKPTVLTLDGDVPEGIPSHLQIALIKHYCLKEIMGEKIEDGQDNTGIGTKYHTAKFYENMIALCDFIGIDAGPQYYGSDDPVDAGVCDG